jgi:hypothetical protein
LVIEAQLIAPAQQMMKQEEELKGVGGQWTGHGDALVVQGEQEKGSKCE